MVLKIIKPKLKGMILKRIKLIHDNNISNNKLRKYNIHTVTFVVVCGELPSFKNVFQVIMLLMSCLWSP